MGHFQDVHCEELNFTKLFFGQPCSSQGIKISYETIVQWGTFAQKSFFHTYTKSVYLIHCVVSSFWISIYKRKFLGCQLLAHGVFNKLNLNVVLHLDLG